VTSSYRFSNATRKPSAIGTGCLRLFFLLFFAAGAWMVWSLTISPFLRVAAASRWEETPCIIDSSRVIKHPGSGSHNSTTYNAEVIYHYDFHGRRYSSSRYEFTAGSNLGYNSAHRIVDQNPPGRQTACYVNPNHPTEAVIQRGTTGEMLMGLIGLIFAAIGAGGIVFAGRLTGPQRASRKNAMPTFTPATGELIELKPRMTPMGKFITTLILGLVWNGFMSIFVYFVFLGPNHSSTPLFAKIIVGLFSLIGVLIILGVIGSFLALFNPRIVLRARTDAVPLGGDFQFEWKTRGRVDKLHKLRIVLIGREDATHQAGKSSQTFSQVFAEIPVVETVDQQIASQGQARVSIPAGLMHSFHGSSNRISWRLEVKGEIPKWPDIDQEHTLQVLPQGAVT